MNIDPESRESVLPELSEEGFGTGAELYTTAYLILGLLTFWVYNVWSFFRTLRRHFDSRLAYLSGVLERSKLRPEQQTLLETITGKAFVLRDRPRNISTVLYLFSMVLMVSLLTFKCLTGSLAYSLDLVVVGMASLSFCFATVYFLWSMCKIMKAHEYHELLLLRMTEDPVNFRMLTPSTTFMRRWNRNQNSIALFLIVSIPLALSPWIGVQHFYSLLEEDSLWLDTVAIAWVTVLLIFAAAFHLWGTKILLSMYNDHLRIEALNARQVLEDTRWAAGTSTSVLGGPGKPGELKPEKGVIPERTLAAIMITDMVQYSKEMETNEEAAYAKLLKHNEMVRTNIARHHGEELKTMGDAFLIRFKSAVDAVRAAIQIQQAFQEHNMDKSESDKIMVRIGIHIGDVLVMGQDIIGTGVNLAARIEPLAEPGGICISADVYNIVRKSIDIKALNLGKKELKNIQDAPEIYQIIVQSMGKE